MNILCAHFSIIRGDNSFKSQSWSLYFKSQYLPSECQQFGSRSSLTFCRSWSGTKPFVMVIMGDWGGGKLTLSLQWNWHLVMISSQRVQLHQVHSDMRTQRIMIENIQWSELQLRVCNPKFIFWLSTNRYCVYSKKYFLFNQATIGRQQNAIGMGRPIVACDWMLASGCSKELSRWDCSFEQHNNMIKLTDKRIISIFVIKMFVFLGLRITS